MLTFRANLVHVYITRCGQVYSYRTKFTIHVLYVGLSHLIFSMYPYFEFRSQLYIICKQPSFIIATPTGIWGVKWTVIWHFRISMKRNTDFVKSLWYQWIKVSLLYRKIKLPMSRNIHRINESQGISKASEPVGACGLRPVWHLVIGIHHGERWLPVPKQFTSPKSIVMLVEEN